MEDIADNHTVTKLPIVPLPPYWNLPTTITLSVFIMVIILLALVGNSMVIIVVARHRGMRTRTNMFLCNLAVADLLCAVICMPFSLGTVISGDWVFGDTFCQINGFSMPLFFVASIHTLMYISIHKYISIQYPFSHVLGKKKIGVMIAAAWFWALLSAYMAVHGLNHAEYKPYTTQCGPSYPNNLRTYMHPLYTILTCYLIPFMIMTFCYLRMFKEIKAHSKRLEETTNQEPYIIFLQQRRITVTLFLVLLAFVICWTPYVVYSVYASAVTDKTSLPHIANALSYWCGYLNSAVNPIIYALRSPGFREGYKEIMCQGKALITSEATEPYEGTLEKLRMFIRNSFVSSEQRSAVKRKPSINSLYALKPRHRTPSTGSLPRNFTYGVGGRFGSVEVTHVNGAPALTVGGKTIYKKPVTKTAGSNYLQVVDPHCGLARTDTDETETPGESYVDRSFAETLDQTEHTLLNTEGFENESELADPRRIKHDLNGIEKVKAKTTDDNVFTVEADVEPLPINRAIPDIIVTSMDSDMGRQECKIHHKMPTVYGRSASDNTNQTSVSKAEILLEETNRSKSEPHLENSSFPILHSIKQLFRKKNSSKPSTSDDEMGLQTQNSYFGISKFFLPKPQGNYLFRSRSAEESEHEGTPLEEQRAFSDGELEYSPTFFPEMKFKRHTHKHYHYHCVSWNELSESQKGENVEISVHGTLERIHCEKPRMMKGMSIEHLDKIIIRRANSAFMEKRKLFFL